MRKLRTLLLEVGLVLLAILLSKIFDTPIGYCIAGVLAIAFIFAWFVGREGDDEFGAHGGPIVDGDIPAPQRPKIPSLVFVFGAPLGDNDSSTWIMMLKHYGPGSAHNCTVGFFDNDRKNLEHQWLVNHPGTPFLPPGQFDESQRSLYVAEAGPEGGAVNSFTWAPLDPDRQHYTVSISCRDGVFVEKWEITRVNGVTRAKIVIEHGAQWIEDNPNLGSVVFKCEDREFASTPLLASVPNLTPRQVHPGWKPNHRFEVPVAIIDPNGYVQVIAAVKLPDGSTATDFGCWNILTKHFGDNPSTQL